MGVANPIGGDLQIAPETTNTLIYLKTPSVVRNRNSAKQFFLTVLSTVLHGCPPVCGADTVTDTVSCA